MSRARLVLLLTGAILAFVVPTASAKVDVLRIARRALHIAERADKAAKKARPVKSKEIVDGSVANADLADGAVDNRKLADGAVDGRKLADGSVGNGKLADGAVDGRKLAAN